MTGRLDGRIRDLMQQVVDQAPAPPSTPLGPSVHPKAPSKMPRWVAAVAVAAAAFALIGGAAWLFGRSGSDPAEQFPTPTVPPTTTFTATQLEQDELPGFPFDSIPPFVGRIVSNTGAGPAEMSIMFGGPDVGLRVALVSDNQSLLEPVPFGELIEGGQGSYLVTDGVDGEIHLLRDGITETWGPVDRPLQRLDWRDDWMGLEDTCQLINHTALPMGEVAGRQTHVLECAGMDQAFNVWIDAETGLVLKTTTDPTISASIVGTYEFTSIQYNQELAPETFQVTHRSEPAPSCEPNCGTDWTEADIEAWVDATEDDLYIGAPAPPLNGTLLDGTPFSLADMQGNPVLLHFWYPSIQILEYDNLNSDWGFFRESLQAERWAAATHGDQITVVSVAPADRTLVETIVGEHHPDIKVLIPADYTINPGCDCPEVWTFGFQPGNTWILVDAEGVVIGYFEQVYPAIAAVGYLIDDLQAG